MLLLANFLANRKEDQIMYKLPIPAVIIKYNNLITVSITGNHLGFLECICNIIVSQKGDKNEIKEYGLTNGEKREMNSHCRFLRARFSLPISFDRLLIQFGQSLAY